jgi:hypothetical protein
MLITVVGYLGIPYVILFFNVIEIFYNKKLKQKNQATFSWKEAWASVSFILLLGSWESMMRSGIHAPRERPGQLFSTQMLPLVQLSTEGMESPLTLFFWFWWVWLGFHLSSLTAITSQCGCGLREEQPIQPCDLH